MIKIVLLLMKLACIITLNYYVVLLLWEYSSRIADMPREVRFRAQAATVLFALSDIIFSTAIWLIDVKNFRRAVVNILFIFIGMIVGWQMGDPMSRGSYDHEGGMETARGNATGGIMGTLVAYGLLRKLRPKTKQKAVDEEVGLKNQSLSEPG